MYNQNTIVINLKKNISSNDPSKTMENGLYIYRRVMTPNCWNVRLKITSRGNARYLRREARKRVVVA